MEIPDILAQLNSAIADITTQRDSAIAQRDAALAQVAALTPTPPPTPDPLTVSSTAGNVAGVSIAGGQDRQFTLTWTCSGDDQGFTVIVADRNTGTMLKTLPAGQGVLSLALDISDVTAVNLAVTVTSVMNGSSDSVNFDIQ